MAAGSSSAIDWLDGIGVRAEPVTEGRVLLSQGTAESASSGGTGYAVGARTPVGPWRRLSEAEASRLGGRAEWPPVRILRLYEPETILALQNEIEVLQRRQAEHDEPWDGPFLTELRTRIAAFCRCREWVGYHRILADPPGLATVSRDDATGLLVGLHVDMWASVEGAPEGPDRPSRVCLNLGVEDRWFLFVNQTVPQMRSRLGRHPGAASDPGADGRAFLEAFPDYPVLKVRVRPGEAYVAATEQLLHDGSSEGQSRPVWHTAVRARLDFPEP